MRVRLEPEALRSRVKHSTTEPLAPRSFTRIVEKVHTVCYKGFRATMTDDKADKFLLFSRKVNELNNRFLL